MAVSRLMRTKWYPRPHKDLYQYGHGLEHTSNGSLKQAVLNPIAFNDEGLGSPSSYKANPENASFAEAGMPNCYPESKIDLMVVEIIMSLTKQALTTDALPGVVCGHMGTFTSFDDIAALDKISTLDIGEVLELQRESSDYQSYPLFNGEDVLTGVSGNTPTLHANVPGLTTNQTLEHVSFGIDSYYDNLQYFTTADKLKKCATGFKWFTLTKQKPFKKIRYFIKPKIKRMNDYSQFSIMTYVPICGASRQINGSGDTTIDTNHVNVILNYRYNEWNQNFDFDRA